MPISITCGKEEMHIHTAACSGKGWPKRTVCYELTCGKENVTHSVSCLTEAQKQTILEQYPQKETKVPAFEDPEHIH